MLRDKFSEKIDTLFRRCAWEEARTLLEQKRVRDPENHWVLTQLGVTFYEQRRYKDALRLFLASLAIVNDCPLTLWNLAGTLDSLGKHSEAIGIYNWLLRSNKSARADPCWESKKWADALKADCVYRLGVCFQHLGESRTAEHCYRQYLRLLSIGIEGLYSIEDVKRQRQRLQGEIGNGGVDGELRKVVDSTLRASRPRGHMGRSTAPPQFDLADLLPASRAASKL